jgi:hypothetical protein
MPERGARIARREERTYGRYVSDEQRREAGCPARQAAVIQRGQVTLVHHLIVGEVFQPLEVGNFQGAYRFDRHREALIDAAARTRFLKLLSRRAQDAQNLRSIESLAFTVITEAHDALHIPALDGAVNLHPVCCRNHG